jgi:hypothetical protein
MAVSQLQVLTDWPLSCQSVLDKGRRQRPDNNSRVTSHQQTVRRELSNDGVKLRCIAGDVTKPADHLFGGRV